MMGADPGVAAAVAAGLSSTPKQLPSWLFYDREGSAIYEEITRLPEYYPTRTEMKIFEQFADSMTETIVRGPELKLYELGAGTALKTVVLLRALQQRTRCTFVPVDVSSAALEVAAARVRADLPGTAVAPMTANHDKALDLIAATSEPRCILFIGSSIGNYEDAEAIALLRRVRNALGPDGTFVLGTDLRKSPSVLVPAYDDSDGVTARFNRNMLVRINRELGGRFDVDRFKHVALWNDAQSRIEMHLQSQGRQEVVVEALGTSFTFDDGERIHTESSIKYDLPHVDRLLGSAGLVRAQTWTDEEQMFAVHLVTARGRRVAA